MKKNILFIMHGMPIGGAEKVLVDLLKHIDYDKYSIDLLLYYNYGELLHEIPNHVSIYSLFEYPSSSFYSRIYRKLLSCLSLSNFIQRRAVLNIFKNKKYDTIISFCQGHAHKLHTFLTGHASKNISWVHTDMNPNNWGKYIFDGNLKKQEFAYNMMDTIVFVSNKAKETFNKTFNISSKINQVCIYNLIDTSKINKMANVEVVPRDNTKIIFSNIGRLCEAKSQYRLIEAANILKKRFANFEIWIIGEGILRKQLEDKISENDLQDYVKLLGLQKNPYVYLSSSDIFVLTSHLEGFPLVVCEALVLGKPIISTKITGPTEILDDSKYGILVEENIEEIANAMYELAVNNDLRLKYSKLSILRSQMFQIDKTLQDIYNIID